jgi:hypothetical protein
MKTFHEFTLKSGVKVVMSRTLFCPVFGFQPVQKGHKWESIKIVFSKNGRAVGDVVDRRFIKNKIHHVTKMCLKKLNER